MFLEMVLISHSIVETSRKEGSAFRACDFGFSELSFLVSRQIQNGSRALGILVGNQNQIMMNWGHLECDAKCVIDTYAISHVTSGKMPTGGNVKS